MKNTDNQSACTPSTAATPQRKLKTAFTTIKANISKALIIALTCSSTVLLLVSLRTNASNAINPASNAPTDPAAFNCQLSMHQLLTDNKYLAITALAALISVIVSQLHIYRLEKELKEQQP